VSAASDQVMFLYMVRDEAPRASGMEILTRNLLCRKQLIPDVLTACMPGILNGGWTHRQHKLRPHVVSRFWLCDGA